MSDTPGLEPMTREEFMKDILAMRGVETPCEECGGLGVTVYGSTATWRGGVGGQAMTSDVCNKCWGSGDKHRHWPSHRRLLLGRLRGATRGYGWEREE